MMKTSVVEQAIMKNRPDEPFVLRERSGEDIEDLSTLDWQANTDPPTLAEVTAWHDELQAELDQEEADALATKTELDQYRSDLAAQYQVAITRLDGIVTNGPTYTATQTRDAVVDMAKIQRAMLKLVKRSLA